MSDYESDNSEIVQKQKSGGAKPKKTPAKRRPAESAASASTGRSVSKASKKPRGTDLFNLEGDAEIHSTPKSSVELSSSVVSKVATGKVKRNTDLSGRFYIDLKIYNKSDILSTRPEERWKKAALTLKVQLDQDSTQWEQLQSFVKEAHELFLDSEPIFYSDKIHFK